MSEPGTGVEKDAGPLRLPSNWGHTYREYGVMHDRRKRGLGIALVHTTRKIDAALDQAAELGDDAHVFYREVTCSTWLGPVADSRVTPPATPTDSTTRGAS